MLRWRGTRYFCLGEQTSAVPGDGEFFLLPCVILSGLFTSIRAMPEWLQTLTVINPLRHAIVALRAIYFENAGFADLVPSLIPIVLAGMLSLAWASWLFRHKIQ